MKKKFCKYRTAPGIYTYLLITLLFYYGDDPQLQAQEAVPLPESIPQLESNVIPILFDRHIFLEGSIGGAQGYFLFDTGANYLCLDEDFLANNNLVFPTMAQAHVPGVGENPKIVELILDPVDLLFSNNRYQSNRTPIVPLKPIVGDIADGILGCNYFYDKVLVVDYQNQQMEIFDDISLLSTESYTRIQCDDVNNFLLVPLHVQVTDIVEIEGRFVLDLGCSPGLVMTSPIAKQKNLDGIIDSKIQYSTKYAGLGGDSKSNIFRARSVVVGGHKLQNVLARYSTDSKGALSTGKNLGLLGNKILSRFDLIIDYKNSALFLRPNNTFNDAFPSPRVGFSHVNRSLSLGGWPVTGVASSNTVNECGIQIDDLITHLDNVPVSEISSEQEKRILDEARQIKLRVMRNGNEIELAIVLRDLLL